MTVTLFHSHGIGHFDFSSLQPNDLDEVNNLAASKGVMLCPTVFLRRDHLDVFCRVVSTYQESRNAGGLGNIVGFALEGPFLGASGGVPRTARWTPKQDEWQRIAALGPLGLKYVVLAVDAIGLDDFIDTDFRFSDLLESLYDQHLRVALGHFAAANPARSAERIASVLGHLHSHYEPSPYLALTDHLFNDMPRNFTHAWRTADALTRRSDEVAAFLSTAWTPETLPDTLGPVPAALLEATRNNLLTPTLNFDGFHVDLEICRRTVSYLGGDRLIAITDDTALNWMAGEELFEMPSNSLRYRSDGAVAVGSCDYKAQIENMISIGIRADDIASMFDTVPAAALAFVPQRRKSMDVR